MSTLFKRGGVWHIAFFRHGKRVYRSTRIKVKVDPRGALARQIQRDVDTQGARVSAGVEDHRSWFEDVVHAYLAGKRTTARTWAPVAEYMARRWVEFLTSEGVLSLEDIRPAHIQTWIARRREKGKSEKTIQQEIQVLRGLVQTANISRALNPISTSTWPRIRQALAQRPERIGAYSIDETRRILDFLRPHRFYSKWYLPCLVLALTGCRYGEMARLRVADVSAGFLRIETHKTARSSQDQIRLVEIHPRLTAELLPTLEGRPPGDTIFPDMEGLQYSVGRAVSRACQVLGIQYRRVHGFRHGWITALLEAGVPVPVVQKLAGHSQITTTMRYCHVTTPGAGLVGKIPL